jgi:hypothetical protein
MAVTAPGCRAAARPADTRVPALVRQQAVECLRNRNRHARGHVHRGAAYISRLGGNRHIRRRGRARRDHEEHILCFQPRLDPLAGALHLTFREAAEEVLVTLDLG